MGEIHIRKDLPAKLRAMPYIQMACVQVASRIMLTAKAIAFTDAYETGRYMKGIVLIGTKVVATDWKSGWIEFGAYGREPIFVARHVLKRAAEANGFRVASN